MMTPISFKMSIMTQIVKALFVTLYTLVLFVFLIPWHSHSFMFKTQRVSRCINNMSFMEIRLNANAFTDILAQHPFTLLFHLSHE